MSDSDEDDDVGHTETLLQMLNQTLQAVIPGKIKRKGSVVVQTRLYKKQELMYLKYTDVFDNVVEDVARSNLLPLGSRVMRGPDWRGMEQDSHGPGTVINHDKRKDCLWVYWDNGVCNVYRYGSNGAFDVLGVDDQPRPVPGDQKIKIGVQVERGPDWSDKLENEDGGSRSHGVVIRRKGQRVLVRWKDGSKHQYSFGENDIYEVSIRDTPACSMDAVSPSQKSMDGPQSRPLGSTVMTPPLHTSHCVPLHDSCSKASQVSIRDTPVCSMDAVSPSQKSMDAVPDALVSEENPAEGEEEIGNYVWQFLYNDEQWRDYSDAENAKLQKEYPRKKTCLIYRNDKSFRVSFNNETERCLEDSKVRRIRKTRKAVPKELVSSEKLAEGEEEEEEIGNYVLHSFDNDDAENANLQKGYTKRKTGTCLSYRNDKSDTPACSMDAVSPSQKSMDAVPEELTSSEKSAEGEEKEIGNYVWQVLDNDEQWREYSDAENAKLQKEYTKRKTGTCLIYRNGKSFRVSFKNETERSVEDFYVRPIRKTRKD